MAVIQNSGSTEVKPRYNTSSSDGQRQGAIGHYAARIVSAKIVAGLVQTDEEIVNAFHSIVSGIDAGFYK